MKKTFVSIAALAFAAWGTVAAAQEVTFENADADGNGGVSLAELHSLLPSVSEDDFIAADIDGSGELSMAEFDALILTIGPLIDNDDDGEDDEEEVPA